MLSHLVVGGVIAQGPGQGQLQGVGVEEQSQLHGRHVSAQGQLASLQPRGLGAQAEREGGGDRAHTHLQAEERDAQTHRQAEGLHTNAHLCEGTSFQRLPEKSLREQWQEFHEVVTDYIKEELELLDITDEMATASLPGLATDMRGKIQCGAGTEGTTGARGQGLAGRVSGHAYGGQSRGAIGVGSVDTSQ